MTNLKRLITFTVAGIVALTTFSTFVIGCGTGIEYSPDPGALRVTMRADYSNSYLVERADSYSVFTWYQNPATVFPIGVNNGAVYQGEKFAYLYTSTNVIQRTDDPYNLFSMEFYVGDMFQILKGLDDGSISLDDIEPAAKRDYVAQTLEIDPDFGSGAGAVAPRSAPYKTHTIFESFLPPGDYDSLQIGFYVPEGKGVDDQYNSVDWNKVNITDVQGRQFTVPLEIPEDESPILYFPTSFRIEENAVTEISIVVSPTVALSRYRDSWVFDRIKAIEVVEVKNP